jgi:hypothetical protein
MLNQIQFRGGDTPRLPNLFGGKKKGPNLGGNDIHKMAVEHALKSVREETAQGAAQKLEETRGANALAVENASGTNAVNLARTQGRETRRTARTASQLKVGEANVEHGNLLERGAAEHERIMEQARQGHLQELEKGAATHTQTLANRDNLFNNLHKIGKSGHTAKLDVTPEGGVSAEFRERPASAPKAETPSPAENVAAVPAEQPPAPTKAPFIPKMRQNAITKKFEPNPDHPDYDPNKVKVSKIRKPRTPRK